MIRVQTIDGTWSTLIATGPIDAFIEALLALDDPWVEVAPHSSQRRRELVSLTHVVRMIETGDDA